MKGCKDLTLDKELMKYLYEGEAPDSVESRGRCERAASWLRVNEFGDLVVHENTGRVREVPLVGKR